MVICGRKIGASYRNGSADEQIKIRETLTNTLVLVEERLGIFVNIGRATLNMPAVLRLSMVTNTGSFFEITW